MEIKLKAIKHYKLLNSLIEFGFEKYIFRSLVIKDNYHITVSNGPISIKWNLENWAAHWCIWSNLCQSLRFRRVHSSCQVHLAVGTPKIFCWPIILKGILLIYYQIFSNTSLYYQNFLTIIFCHLIFQFLSFYHQKIVNACLV